MNKKMICRVLGMILLCLAVFMLLPLIAGLCFGEPVLNFIITIGLIAAVGLILFSVKPDSSSVYAKEGFLIVGLGWILVSLLGALPFVLSGDIPNYIDALFEIASGLSTTGASILNDIESMSRGCMFWRLFSHWIGGMGVLVFIMAVLPMSGEHSMHIMRAEVPGPTVGKLVPKLKQTAKILYFIYILLTLIETVLLLLGGMNFYEAILHSFATAGTGGFSTRAESISAFNSTYIETVITVFMFLFGINFNLYYLILIGRLKDALKNEELHWYLIIILATTAAITIGISKMYGGAAEGLRYALFNVASLLSTSGFGNTDFVLWPEYCKWILVMLMFCGGCAGSTGGGFKLSRVMMLLKSCFVHLRQTVRPRSVNRVMMEGKAVKNEAVFAVTTYGVIYIFLIFLVTFIISFDGYDITTNFTAALSCLSNIGPGMGLIGPTGNFAIFSGFSKVVLTFTMLLGRLEIYPLLVLFAPGTWRK